MVEKKIVKKGDKIKVEYTGTLDDGTVFDSSQHDGHSHPIEFEVGSGQVIQGFDKAVTGMKLNEEKEFKILAKDAYGDSNMQLIQEISRDKLPKEPEPKKGMWLGMQTPDGHTIKAKIIKVTKTAITIDLNHPLAGKDLTFKIKVVGIS